MTQPVPAVFFLSDYGTADEFVGVVHAVLHRLAPHVPVIDLCHQVAPFDVAGGAAMLVRCAPHLGAGVVLAVVDPGVGTSRRAVAIRTTAGRAGSGAPTWLVGPDNGLLLPMAAAYGGVESAVAIDGDRVPGSAASTDPGTSADPGTTGPTFDGRDLFAPAATSLVLGADPGLFGNPVDPASLVVGGVGPGVGGLEGPAPTGPSVRTSVSAIDRFGNVQLEAGAAALGDMDVPPGLLLVRVANGPSLRPSGEPGATTGAPERTIEARRVTTFGELDPGQLGLLVDSSGHLALVLDRASASTFLHPVGVGSGVIITPVLPGRDGG